MGFFSKKKVDLSEQNISTIIGEGCTIEGNLKSREYVRIDGTIEGHVTVDQGLILGEKGFVHGNVKTQEIVVYGVIHGDIYAKKLEVKSSGEIKGTISTQKIQMDLGSIHNGLLSMHPENATVEQIGSKKNASKENNFVSQPK